MKVINMLTIFLLITQTTFTNAESLGLNWAHSSGNTQSFRFTHDSQVTTGNIQDLKPAWTYFSNDLGSAETIQSSPIFTGNKVISVNLLGHVFAIDPADGNLLWKTYIGSPAGRRGLTSFTHDSLKIFVPNNEGVVEIDEESGKILHRFRSGGSLVAPIASEHQLLIATIDDGIKSYNIHSKEQLWHIDLEKNNVNPRIWSGFSFEPKLGLAFVVTGSSDGLLGINRADSDNSVSVIAVDIENGEIEWSFQHIPHDVWDLDLIGNPIIHQLEVDGIKRYVVTVLSKTGDILVLDALNGKPTFKNSFQNIPVQQSNIEGEVLSKYQKKYLIPEPYSDMLINPDEDFSHLDKTNAKFINTKLRNAKFGFFIPPSVDYDVAMYGLHGGANWFGGSLDLTSSDPELVIPYNRDPWILRAYHQDKIHYFLIRLIKRVQNYFNPSDQAYISPWVEMKSQQSQVADKIHSFIPFTPNSEMYQKDCSSCHGSARQGTYQDEAEGDLVYPPLVGLSLTKKFHKVSDAQSLIMLHDEFNISLNISNSEYSKMLAAFKKYDERLQKFNMLGYTSFWQLLLDKDGYPATKPPWGLIAKSNLASGKILWKQTFGSRIDEGGVQIAKGDKNFGGVMTTSSGIIFATGTPDKHLYAFNSKSGEEIWSHKLPFAGSAPPMSYMFNGCQYVVIQASGGKYVGYDSEKGNALASFALNNCSPKTPFSLAK
jgi:quinoprotein glucose dehydrogenase